jgi:ribosomal protein L7/L12
MTFEELSHRADSIISVYAKMNDTFGDNGNDHLRLAIIAGLKATYSTGWQASQKYWFDAKRLEKKHIALRNITDEEKQLWLEAATKNKVAAIRDMYYKYRESLSLKDTKEFIEDLLKNNNG